MVYKVGIVIEELIDEDDEIQGDTWYYNLKTFATVEEAQEFASENSIKIKERS